MQRKINVEKVRVEGNAIALPSVKACSVVAGQCFGNKCLWFIFLKIAHNNRHHDT